MSAGDVLAVVAATVVTMLVAVLAATLVALARTLRDLRDTANALHDEALPLLEAARDAVCDAAVEVDRVERLVTSAERLSGAVDGASRLAARTLALAGREGDGVRHRRVARRADGCARARRRCRRAPAPRPAAQPAERDDAATPDSSRPSRRRPECSSGCSG